MLKYLSILSVLLPSVLHAQAAIRSEYFYQAQDGQALATPSLGYEDTHFDYKTGNNRDVSLTTMAMRYERGLSQTIAVGGAVDYVSGHNDYTAKTSKSMNVGGMGDLRAYVKGESALGSGSTALNYGATFNASVGDKVYNASSYSPNSGGMGLQPYLGYQTLVNRFVVGANVTTFIEFKDRSIWRNDLTPQTSSTSHGGDRSSVTAFGETPIDAFVVGGSLEYWNDSTSRETLSNGKSSESPGQTGYTLGAYTRYSANQKLDLLGRLGREAALTDHASVSSRASMIASLGLRMIF